MTTTEIESEKSRQNAQHQDSQQTDDRATDADQEQSDAADVVDETAVDEILATEPEDLSTLSEAELAEALGTARDQINEMKDGYLRAKAEMENIRRRSQKEVIAARKFAIEGFAQEVINVKDSLDQAARVELEEGAGDAIVKMKEGLELTSKQLDAAMAKFAVVEVEAGPGVKFDPEQHQAISMVPSEEIESNHIVDVMQKGFLLKDRLLRPAMVVVAS
jgi:molecular chaperone GrpE